MLALSAGQVLLARGAQLPQGLSRADLTAQVRIISLSDEGRFTRLRLAIENCRPLESERPGCAALDHVRVSWYDPPALTVNDRWRLTLRLRPPAGFANPDTFDYGAWLWREGIDATGYVRDSPSPHRLAVGEPGLREAALGYLDRHVADPLARRWLAALTLGAAERLDSADWELLNATGTTHIMVISGLHVGLMAALVLGLTRGLARLITPRRWRLTTWPWWCAAAAAIGYAGLAGLEPPALRAMIMTLVGLWVASGRHAPGPWQGWWLALAVIVLLDPLALWRPGLWLSFVAVGLLILIWQGRTRPSGGRGWLVALLRSQCLLAPLMAAAVLLAFDRLAPAAPVVNLLVVPLVGSLMVPLGLAGWLLAWLPPLAEGVWQLFALLAQALHALLAWCMSVMPLWQPPAWQAWPLALGLILLASLWALPGVARTPRWAGSVALLLMGVTLTPPSIATGTLQVRVQDVGQGQLLALRTAHHRVFSTPGRAFVPASCRWRRCGRRVRTSMRSSSATVTAIMPGAGGTRRIASCRALVLAGRRYAGRRYAGRRYAGRRYAGRRCARRRRSRLPGGRPLALGRCRISFPRTTGRGRSGRTGPQRSLLRAAGRGRRSAPTGQWRCQRRSRAAPRGDLAGPGQRTGGRPSRQSQQFVTELGRGQSAPACGVQRGARQSVRAPGGDVVDASATLAVACGIPPWMAR